ncbi:MAG: hypothetical protein AB7C97_01720 [Oscillospiraceae bacterium]
MKTWQKKCIGFAIIMVLVLISAYLLPRMFPPEGSVPLRNIVSSCVGDATNDGTSELLAISGDGEIDTGERHGGLLLVCDASAQTDIERLGYIPSEKIRYRIDLSEIKPIKVQLGDVNGDGVNEVAVCVYKTTKFYPIMAKRPFFFDLVEGNLIPVWLGSRLSRPFDDYILYDIDADTVDEVISIEQLENGERVLAVYNWKGFGFEMLTQSEKFDGKLCFDSDSVGQTAGTGEISVEFSNGKEHTGIIFRLTDDKLVYSIDTELEGLI